MTNLRIILCDQLTHDISFLSDINKDEDIVLMVELHSKFTYVKHHKENSVSFICDAAFCCRTCRFEYQCPLCKIRR